MSHTKPEPQFDVRAANILETLFRADHLKRAIARMRSWRESENEVTHPLNRIILLEYADDLATSLAASVPAGTWHPSPSYVLLVAKRSGTYRELAFPNIIDAIVGRRIIDALEPHITKDDSKTVFFGRSKSNADRQRGDYENWFQVWLDFTAEIGSALEADGYTYVFNTDVTQFFPSVDRTRAKQALAQRTLAHHTLLELLFLCLESWCPRIRYCPVPGLPIEPNDVSRLVAHNYIKGVDEHFVSDPSITYLRWVDDTVVFVSDETEAHRIKRRHHLALREMGLSPNASKTSIEAATSFGESRHPFINRQITAAKESNDKALLAELVSDWYSRSPEQTPNWDKVATRLYTTARAIECDALRSHALEDIRRFPRLQRAVFRYLQGYDLPEPELRGLLTITGDPTSPMETRIEAARFLCDACVSCDTRILVNSVLGHILKDDEEPGVGYYKALLLICLNKYGQRDDRDRAASYLTIDRLQDDQLRLHYLYVYFCRDELPEAVARSVRHVDTTDIALMLRVCRDAREGRLKQHTKCLAAGISTYRGRRTILARYLPFLYTLLRADGRRPENIKWLRMMTSSPVLSMVSDQTVCTFLKDELTAATR